jgi:hypothetical protein
VSNRSADSPSSLSRLGIVGNPPIEPTPLVQMVCGRQRLGDNCKPKFAPSLSLG